MNLHELFCKPRRADPLDQPASKRDLVNVIDQLRQLLSLQHGVATKSDLRELKELIRMNQTELNAKLEAANAKLAKVQAEQTDRFNTQTSLLETQTNEIKRLTELLNQGGPMSAEVEATLGKLEANLQAFDDTIPDPQNAEA